jgi:hypothetical protein
MRGIRGGGDIVAEAPVIYHLQTGDGMSGSPWVARHVGPLRDATQAAPGKARKLERGASLGIERQVEHRWIR